MKLLMLVFLTGEREVWKGATRFLRIENFSNGFRICIASGTASGWI